MTEGLIERGEYKIKLGLQNAPIVAEQLALFDMGGDAPVYEAPADAPSGILAPARTVPQEVIDLALCTGGNEPNSAERIAVFYMRERPEQENISFPAPGSLAGRTGAALNTKPQVRRLVSGGRHPPRPRGQYPHWVQQNRGYMGAGIGADSGTAGGGHLSLRIRVGEGPEQGIARSDGRALNDRP